MPFRLFGEPGSAAVEKERTEHDEITKIGDNDYEWSRNTRRPSAGSCHFSLVSGEKLVWPSPVRFRPVFDIWHRTPYIKETADFGKWKQGKKTAVFCQPKPKTGELDKNL